ncbi:MAG: hypothetical protein CSB48_02900 [Proteobacteria bacterium]|nr:MAG: hypothetical protein CSB48_02900 [Pseudomonadota bacterium]
MTVTTQTTLANFASSYDSLTTQGEDQVLEITDTGTLEISKTLNNSISDDLTITATSLYNPASPSDPHVIFTSLASVFTIKLDSGGIRFKGLEFVSSSETVGILALDVYRPRYFEFDRCVLTGGYEIQIYPDWTANYRNTTVKNATGNGIYARSGAGTKTIEDCVIVGCNKSNSPYRGGIHGQDATLKNVVALNNGHADIREAPASSQHLATGDNTAVGTDTVTGVTSEDFTDFAGGIYTAKAGGKLAGSGLNGKDIGLNLAPLDSLVIASIPDISMHQRSNGGATLAISGDYETAIAPTAIEISVDSGSWEVLDEAPASNSFAGSITLQTGVHTVAVRVANQPTLTAQLSSVRVGDIYLTAISQSNHTNAYGTGSFTGPAGYCSEFTGGEWKDYETTPHTAYFPLLANRIANEQGVPTGYITVAQGSTTMAQWQEGEGLMNAALAAFNAATSAGAYNLSWIGEGDANANTPENTFKSQANAAIDYLHNQTGLKSIITLIPTPGPAGANIRQWFTDVVDSNPNAVQGPNMYGIQSGVHYQTQEETQAAADALYDVLYPPVESVLSINVGATMPNGSYKTVLLDSLNNIITADAIDYDSGAATVALPVLAGTSVTGFVIDNENPHTKGAVIVGATA